MRDKTVCPNCGSPSVENYCSHCGQRFHKVHSMREFARHVADDQFGVDAKLPHTLGALFFKPGLLTAEYMAGRIVRYIPPFRLYLFASVLFFVMLSFLSGRSDWAERAAEEMQSDTILTAQEAAADSARRKLNIGVSMGDRQWLDEVEVRTPWPWLDERVEANLQELSRLPPNVALRRITDAMIEELPKVMFVLLPLYALLLKLLYVRRKRYYLEHFIFALHVHAFAFALFAFVLVYRADWFVTAVTLTIALYTLLAMKRVYAQGVVKTTLKWAVLGVSYSVLLGFGFAMAVVLALAVGAPT